MRIALLPACIAAVVSVACGSVVVPPASQGGAPTVTVSASPQATIAERSCGLDGQAMANAYGPGTKLVAAFSVTAQQMAAWQERWPVPGPNGPHLAAGSSRYRTHPRTELLAVCWFDGSFVNFGHAGGAVGAACPATGPSSSAACVPGTNPPTPVFTRLVVTLDPTGAASLLSIAPRESLAISDPTEP